MHQPPVKSSSKAVKSRLGLKVAALFLGTFLAVFIGLFFLDLLLTLGENTLVDAGTSSQPPAAAIDPKLETELAKVLERSDPQTTAEIKNPFADTSGISNKSGAATSVATVSPNAARSNVAAPTGSTVGGQVPAQKTQSVQQQQQNLVARTIEPNQNANVRAQDETRTRLRLREDRIRLGQDGGPESAVFAIDDLLPVGVVSGGDGKDEVMFYSESACRVVSFPVGTQFYDGWFDSLRQEGVVFGVFDQFRSLRMRAWGRSVKEGCNQQGLLERTSPNQALTTGGGD